MKAVLLVTALLACGGCVESTFCLSRGSALPQGLRADEEAQCVSMRASRIELWFYTSDPPKLKFFAGPDVVLIRQGSDAGTGDGAFSVRFNGVDSSFRRVASPNVVAVDERSDGSSRDGR